MARPYLRLIDEEECHRWIEIDQTLAIASALGKAFSWDRFHLFRSLRHIPSHEDPTRQLEVIMQGDDRRTNETHRVETFVRARSISQRAARRELGEDERQIAVRMSARLLTYV